MQNLKVLFFNHPLLKSSKAAFFTLHTKIYLDRIRTRTPANSSTNIYYKNNSSYIFLCVNIWVIVIFNINCVEVSLQRTSKIFSIKCVLFIAHLQQSSAFERLYTLKMLFMENPNSSSIHIKPMSIEVFKSLFYTSHSKKYFLQYQRLYSC